MSFRAPTLNRGFRIDTPLEAALRHEAAAEMAGALGRAVHRLENALSRLAHTRARLNNAVHTGNAADRDAAAQRWQVHHAEACEALWAMVIQRELCGLNRHEPVLRALAVPQSVRVYMGPSTSAAAVPLPVTSDKAQAAPSTGRGDAP